MEKTYIIEGLKGYRICFNGKMLEFRRSGYTRPACQLITSDEEAQNYIENSADFKNGMIALYAVETPAEDEAVELKENLQVKSMTAAVNTLVSKYGCVAEELQTIEDVIEKSHEKGIRFVKLEEQYGEGKAD